MNTPNPLVPQGSLLEQQKSKGKSNLFIAVFMILAVHVVVFAGLLMQGCKPKKADVKPEELSFLGSATNPTPASETLAPAPQLSAPRDLAPAAPPAETTHASAPPPASTDFGAPVTPAPGVLPTETPILPPAATQEYKVEKGDSFYTIAKAHGISVGALAKANPDANSRRLQVGQVLVLPAPEAAVSAVATPGGAEAAAPAADGTTYSVKAGDNLTKIARSFGTTVKAIQRANGIRTTQLKVGQKLKIPAGKPSTAAGANPDR